MPHTAFFDETSSSQRFVASLLEKADVQINGDRPWDMQLNAHGVIEDALARGNLGLGERYMDGDWDAEQLDKFFFKLMHARLPDQVNHSKLVFHHLKTRLVNLQTAKRAFQVGEAHYDLGNEFYAAMLDKRMTYTCGYWKDAKTLDEAQEAKLDLICRKLELKPGMRVLDIGCGWGSFMAYAAEHYGVECVGLTISKEQAEYGKQLMQSELPVEFRLKDYRDETEQFDRIVSVGMFEHVGRKNYREYMSVANRCLKDDGLFLLHTIGKNVRNTSPDPWIDKYIFPNGELPALSQVTNAAESLFVVEDVHNFGADYDRTLMAWHDNFEANWPQFKDQFSERFYRMWRYYLLSCAGAFRARDIQLWQFVLSKKGVIGGYDRVS
ncbi:cyclopropane fatty acyl phospholipid synthase [Vreelandella boliviensis]|uniref:Cyclopropane-fatty-acyl-phospholipid synthase n=1 Tax=Vreelandella boliviensis LC1 TaxID=1072583 RepID=A0A265E161_9GAMM|nr:cyclopropane fatty acyl phospholipid synthase [Halomonas boliviensis]EHJ92779.1 Cyclopropane-fatty-acyl-phospholipid synthase [Halomonas boliviensis LC1]OZT75332.1 cyclopropane-fatty-acyl-phospholipid synthase [Halomonas boliviensis LC1]